MGAIVDTSVLIAAERGELDLDALLESHGAESIAISAITASELLHGVHRLKSAVGRAHAQRWIEDVLSILPVVPFDLEVARVHAALSAELRARGTPIGAHDLIIAATAVYRGCYVATRDRRSFRKIRGLAIQFW